MKIFYCAHAEKVGKIAQDGIMADEDGTIPVIVVDKMFLMSKFVVDSYAFEILGIEEYCYFEISPKGISGKIIDTSISDMFSPFYKLLKQHSIQKQFLTPQMTDRYESMGLGTGIFLVENKDKFNETYKKKILEYAEELK